VAGVKLDKTKKQTKTVILKLSPKILRRFQEPTPKSEEQSAASVASSPAPAVDDATIVKTSENNDNASESNSTPAPAPKPEEPKLTAPISLKAVQAGIKNGTELVEGDDGHQYQRLLNRYTGFELVTDGVLGRNTRVVTAQAQLKVARANGNKSLSVDDTWPNKGYNSDLDGVPGKELFKAIGAINTDK